MRKIIAVAFTLMVGIMSPAPASAQDDETGGTEINEPDCGHLHLDCETDFHRLGQGMGESDDLKNVHTGCKRCVNNTSEQRTVPWSQCHPPCDLVTAFGAEVMEAARVGDVPTLIRLAPLNLKMVRYNFARASIQVTDCTGNLVANLPAPGIYAALAGSVSSSSVASASPNSDRWFEGLLAWASSSIQAALA